MKFSAVAKGTSNEKPVAFKVNGSEAHTLVRPLSALEENEARSSAIKHTKSKGAEPKDGVAIYDSALMAAILAIACVDPDSKPGARESYFDLGMEQVLSGLDTDTLVQVFEQQQMHQEQCSPRFTKANLGHLIELADEFGRVTEDPKALTGLQRKYLTLPLNTRMALLLFMGAELRLLRAFKSSSTSAGSNASPSDESEEPGSPSSLPEASSSSLPTPVTE